MFWQIMAQSKYASTRETTNLARVARIILGPCTDVLQAILIKEISPSVLSKKVKAHLAKQSKHEKLSITKEQEKLVYNGKYSEFDITLLYFLLRNIVQIKPHSNKWGSHPCLSDRSLSANIERIRLIRNEYGHTSKISISDTDFHKRCNEIHKIIQELEDYLDQSTVFQNAVLEIKSCPMDTDQESRYINQLQDINEKLCNITGNHFMVILKVIKNSNPLCFQNV